VAALAATPDVQPPNFRVERQPVANGAELLTVFGSLPDNTGEIPLEIPLVSVLRDNLGGVRGGFTGAAEVALAGGGPRDVGRSRSFSLHQGNVPASRWRSP